jgi:hypothetical protein
MFWSTLDLSQGNNSIACQRYGEVTSKAEKDILGGGIVDVHIKYHKPGQTIIVSPMAL